MDKKVIFFFSGLALFTAALVLGADFFLRRVPVPPPPALPLPPIIDEGANDGGSNGDGGAVYHIQKGTVDHRPIRYTAAGFSPTHIIIQETDDLSCLITVVNQSDAPLRVGVNPHDPAGDPGANYGEITPGKAGILDVRYSGLLEVSLHNHQNPGHEFSVEYGPGCQ
ncbi:MAG: hypothetical protein Q8R35_03585 [bacterium]|nr:hypothetical protein [bacterium]